MAVGAPVFASDGHVGAVAGTRAASAGNAQAYLLVQQTRLFGLVKRTYMVPLGWLQEVVPGARRVTLSASVAAVMGSPPLRPDADIRTDVADALWPNGVAIYPARIGVSVLDGVVELSGHARNRRDTFGAVGRAWAVPGVLAVTDHVADDETITRDVAQALTQDPETRRAGLVVRSHLGAVELEGNVPSTGAATMATTLAGGVAGVIGVQNRAAVRLAPAATV